MNIRFEQAVCRLLVCMLVCSAGLWPAPAAQAGPPAWQPGVATLENSRALAQALGGQLKAALTEAMSEGGAVAAIRVCRDRAPQIAAELSRQSGAGIGRTSLRYRNPLNAPAPWQAAVLRTRFAVAAADTDGPMEYFVSDEQSTRYMRAIYLQPLCATCHGEALTPDVQQALREDYPHDQATGFRIGALRGAFTVTWPGQAVPPAPAVP